MEAFRTLIKGWVGKVLLVIFLVPFALVGMEGLFSLGSKSDVAATVNKKDVLNRELEQAVNQRRQQLLPQVGNDESKIDNGVLRQQVLDGLVERGAFEDDLLEHESGQQERQQHAENRQRTTACAADLVAAKSGAPDPCQGGADQRCQGHCQQH